MSASLFDNNGSSLAAPLGGALYTDAATTIVNTTFSNNRLPAATFLGGGALVSRRMLTMTNSTFVNNSSNSDGGAIFLDFGEAWLTNVTLSGNSAGRSGAGIFVTDTTSVLNLNNVTITANTADSDTNGSGDGGGIFNTDGAVSIQNSIIAGNVDSGPTPNHPDCSGTFLSFGYNLIGSNAGCGGFTNGTNADIVGTVASPINALLAPLAYNGGATRTRALLAGSPALNSASPFPPGSGGLACAATDQRGVMRPQAGTCDMGAYEQYFALLFLPLVRR